MKKVLCLLCLLMFSIAAGCGSPSIKTDNGDEVSLSKNGVEVTGEDGSKSQLNVSGDSEKGLSLPEDFPKDIVPILDDAKIQIANKNEDENKKVSWWVTYYTAKKSAEAYKFYEDSLKDLQESNKTQMNGVYSIGGVKGENRIDIVVGAESSENKSLTTINITIQPQ